MAVPTDQGRPFPPSMWSIDRRQEGEEESETDLCRIFFNLFYFLELFYLGFCLCISLYNLGRKVVEGAQAGGHETDSVHH